MPHRKLIPVLEKAIPVIETLLGSKNKTTMPIWIHIIGCVVTCAALVLPAVIYRARTSTGRDPRIHIFHDMDHQSKYKTQSPNSLYGDDRAMRLPVVGTIARGQLRTDKHLFTGRVNGGWATGLPAALTVDNAFLDHGEQRYNIFCAPCHAVDGFGNGPIPRQLENQRLLGTIITVPANLHSRVAGAATQQPLGQLFNTVTNGLKTMPAYKGQIPTADRWAIVAYVKALQNSRYAPSAVLPAAEAPRLRQAEADLIQGWKDEQKEIRLAAEAKLKAEQEAKAAEDGKPSATNQRGN